MRRALLVTVALLVCAAAARAGEDNRRVLALYDSTEPRCRVPHTTDIHLRLEKPLNWLGMVAEYHDVNLRPLPDASRYRAIVAWFQDDRMHDPAGYCRWVREAVKRGVRVVLIGGLGAGDDSGGKVNHWADVVSTMAELGLRIDEAAEPTNNPFGVEIRDDKPERFGFETRMPPEEVLYRRVVATDKRVEAWRSIARKGVPDSAGVAVAVAPWGGYVLEQQYMVRVTQRPFYLMLWDLNPFDFLEAALGCADTLRPDVTTVCGARAAYSHIDGDGMNNFTVDVPGPRRHAGQVILDEVIQRYPVPVTVGPISGLVDSGALGSAQLAELGRKVLCQPNVQPACHAYGHPLIWGTGVPGLKWPGYRFSVEFEVRSAVEFLNRELLSGCRKVEVFLWSGDCRPGADALALCEDLGIENLNGGDARYDSKYRSVSNLCPLARPEGGLLQVYASAQNENTYTDLWTDNYGGYRAVIETFERCESPRRLMPVNVYYHFYSGERMASLRAVQDAYEWSLRQPLCWIHAAEYVRTVKAFVKARCGRAADGAYWIEDYAPLGTARLDACRRHVDMERSRGVVGFIHHQGSLYVALAPAARAEIVLADAPPARPFLRRSASFLREVKAGPAEWSSQARRYAPGFIELGGFTARRRLTARVGDASQALSADERGMVRVPVDAGKGEWVEVRVAP